MRTIVECSPQFGQTRAQLEAVQAVHAAVAARAGSSGAATARGRTGRRRPRSTSLMRAVEPRDEEAVGAVAVRERLQVLRHGRMLPDGQVGAQVSRRRSPRGRPGRLPRPARSRRARSCRSSRRGYRRASAPRAPASRISALELGQRLGAAGLAPAGVGARGERAEVAAGRVDEDAVEGPRRAAASRPAVRTSTIVAPIRCAVCAQRLGAARRASRRRRSRPRCPSARRGGWSCRRARRTGRARARRAAGASARETAIAARDCGISSAAAPTPAPRRCRTARRGSAPRASTTCAGSRSASSLGRRLERVGAQRRLGRLVVGGHQRARGLGAERVEPQLARSTPGGECASAACAAVRVGELRRRAGAPSRAARRSTALTRPAPRGASRLASSTDSPTAACAGTRSRKVS